MKKNNLRLHPKQSEVVKDKHRFKVLLWGRRTGKTVLAIEMMLFTAMSKSERRVAYIAPTYQAARDIAWAQLKARVKDIPAKANESRLEIEVPTRDGGTSLIILRSWDSIDTLRGQFFDFLVLDEVAQYTNFWEGWHETLRPTLTDRKGKAMFISTPLGFNHFYDLYNIDDPDYRSFHATTYDNPHIDDEEIENAKREMTEDRFAQEYLADFRKQEGLVYKEFNRTFHTFDAEKIDTAWTYGGVDFGYVHPAAVLTVKLDRHGHFWVTDELYKSGLTDAQLAEYVAAKGYDAVYPDPAQPQGIKEMQERGVNVREVVKGKDSVRAGIQKIRELLKARRLHIHKSCKNLIHEFETYSYKEGTEEPIKENDHALDALRYVALMVDGAKKQNVIGGQQMRHGLTHAPVVRKIENRAF